MCTWQRTRVFTDTGTVDPVWEQFRQTAEREHCEIVAYCFMPDHAHLLVAGADPSADFCRFVRHAKQQTGWRYKRKTGCALWQESYHDWILRGVESTASVAAYILGNPIRAGLVERVEDYPFWGSALYSREQLIEFVSSRT